MRTVGLDLTQVKGLYTLPIYFYFFVIFINFYELN